MRFKVTVYCDHVSSSHVHCNKYATVQVSELENVGQKLRHKGWNIKDNEVLCDEHSNLS